MSNQEQQKQEPAKSVPPETSQESSKGTSQQAAQTSPQSKPPKRRGFFSQLFSHLMVALIAVIAVAGYMHWSDVLKYTGSRVCSYDMLGKYASQSPKVPPINLSKPVVGQSKQSIPSPAENAPNASVKKDPAKEIPKDKQVKAPPAPLEKGTAQNTPAKAENLDQALEGARKLFWANDPTTAAVYEKLVVKNPDNADLKAELGNVYFKFDKKNQAAGQFFQAGTLFAKQKNAAKVAEMVKILEKFSPEKAKELNAVNVNKN